MSRQGSGRRCVFCGGRVNSREHVLPEWLKEVLSVKETIWNVSQERVERGDVRASRTFPARPLTHRVRYLCRTCNTGWMSNLEFEAKPFLRTMIEGRGRELHAGGQRLVSIWAFKTAAMFDLVGMKGPALPSEHLHWLYEHRDQPDPLPRHMHVWLAALLDRDMASIYRHHALEIEGVGDGGLPGQANGYTATFTVGHLAFQVFGTLDPDGFAVEDTGQHAAATLIRVWPPPGRSIVWPPVKGLDRAGIEVLADRFLR